MTNHRYLMDEHVHSFYPTLAERIGLNEAIVLQQIHSWIGTYLRDANRYHDKHYHDGAWWIWNSYPDWHAKLPYLSESTVKRALLHMREMGILRVGNYNTLKIDRTYWYTIDYGEYDNLWASAHYTKTDAPSDQNDLMEETNLDRPLPSSSPDPSASKEPALPDSPAGDYEALAQKGYSDSEIDSIRRTRKNYQAPADDFKITEADGTTTVVHFAPDDNSLDDTPLPRMPPQRRTTVQATLRVRGDGKPREGDLRFDELPIPRESGANDSITEEPLAVTGALFPDMPKPEVPDHIRTVYLEKADDPPADAIVWSEPSQHKTTAEEFQGRHAHTVEGLTQETEQTREKAWSSAMSDWKEWLDRPVREWCVLIGLAYEQVPEPRKHSFATELSRLATTDGMHKTPEEASEAIRAIARNQDDYGWLRSAGHPKHGGFAEAFLNVLCGQVLPEGKRNGGSSTGQPQPSVIEFQEPDFLTA